MKKDKILLILLAVLLVACKQEPAKVNYMTVSGKVENLKGGTIWMLNFDGFSHYINVKDDGTFVDTVRIEKSGAYLIDFEKKRSEIYVENNAIIEFFFDAKDFNNSLKFASDYASLNNHLAKKAIANDAYFNHMEAIYSLNAEECKNTLQAEYVTPFNESLEKLTDISEELKKLERDNIRYGYLVKLGYFESFHKRYTENVDYQLPRWLEKEQNNFSLDDVKALQYSTSYASLISGLYRNKAYGLMKKDSLSYQNAYLNVIASIENEGVKNYLNFNRFQMYLSALEDKQAAYDVYIKNNTDEAYAQRAESLFKEAIKLEPGSPSPKFVDYESHAGGTVSLDDFKGKYVYIDIWATWCGPCKREIPFLEKVEQQYHDKNIEFVTISVDYKKDYEKWKAMVTEKDMKGTQLIATDAFNSEFVSAFNISGIPRFILIDPDGNIITANAPQPSDEALIELFNKCGI